MIYAWKALWPPQDGTQDLSKPACVVNKSKADEKCNLHFKDNELKIVSASFNKSINI